MPIHGNTLDSRSLKRERIISKMEDIMTLDKMTFALAGIIVFMLFFANPGNGADSGEWIWYGKTEMGDSYYDKGSLLKVGPKVFRILNKDKYSEAGKAAIIQGRKAQDLPIDGYDQLDYVLDHLELDCENITIKDMGFLEYDHENNILYGFEYPVPKTIPILPGTTTETLLKALCP